MEIQQEQTKDVTLPVGGAAEEVKPGAEEVIVQETKKPEEKIIFRGREFKSKEEAVAHFEKLEDEKNEMERARIEAEAYNMGIRDALSRAPAATQSPQPEEDLEQEFYQDVKGTLKKVHASAKSEAIAEIRKELEAKDADKAAWDLFSTEHPDLADSRKEVERILAENPHILKLQDKTIARKELAIKTRSYFHSIAEKFAPTKELTGKKGPAVSAGGGSPSSVTQQTKTERPLTFVEQMKKLKGRG